MVTRVKDALKASTGALERAGVGRPRYEAELILCHVLGRDRVALYLEAYRPLREDENRSLEEMLLQRSACFPLQYITGKVGFYTCELLADSRALIPRPDTEAVVDAVLELAGRGMDFKRIVDVGTGSGNIAVVLAGQLPRSEIWATDVSGKAITLARENAISNGVGNRVHFLVADLLRPFSRGSFDLIVANLPYISDAEWPSLPPEVREYEPSIALRGGQEGLAIMRPMIMMAFGVLADDGVVIIELGHKQGGPVHSLLAEAGYRDIEIRRDINGKPRVAVAFKRPPAINGNG